MGEILVAISAAAGLVTLGTFMWYLVRQHDADGDDPAGVEPESQLRQDILEATGDITLTSALLKLYKGVSGRSPPVTFTEEEKQFTKIGEWLDFLDQLVTFRQHSRILGRHLPPELQPHKKELLQFLEDGLADLGRKKRKRFLFTQYFSLAIYLGKARLFKISKTWRRTIR